jgi:hypothetical protein
MDNKLECRRRLHAITGKHIECIAASGLHFVAACIDGDLFTNDEKIGAYIHVRDFIGDVMKYTARRDLEQLDLVELDMALRMLRNMLDERGIVRGDDDRQGL